MLSLSPALWAACEWRRLDLDEDAARKRRAATAIASRTRQEDVMLEDHDGSIVRRGVDEALACRDLLAPAPVRPSWRVRVVARLVAAVDAFARHDPVGARALRAASPAVRDRHGIPRWPFTTGRVWR
jgi:hypothetical protein